MKIKKFSKVFIILLVFFSFINVKAASRDDASTKTPINIQGKTFYAGVEVEFNNFTRTGFIGDIDIKYDQGSNKIIASVKRSQINSVIESTDKNVYLNIELNIDYHDYSYDEYTIYSNEDGSIFWINEDGNTNSKSYIEFLSTAVEIMGGVRSTAYSSGVHALYKGDYFIKNDLGGNHPASDFTNQQKEASLTNIGYDFYIVEDTDADMQNITTVDVGQTDEGSQYKEDIKIDNFYQMVDNNKKAILSLAMYDNDGKPIDFDDKDMTLKIDESENQKDIVHYFENDNIDKIQILTINFKKKFEGKANIKTYVKKKFAEDKKVNLYYYNVEKGKMELIQKDVKIDENGYATFTVEHFSEYVITTADNKLASSTKPEVTKKTNKIMKIDTIYLIIGGAVLLVLILITVSLIIRSKKRKKLLVKE